MLALGTGLTGLAMALGAKELLGKVRGGRRPPASPRKAIPGRQSSPNIGA